GWRIIAPSNAFDYIGLFNSSMISLDPVLIIEHHALYDMTSPIPSGNLDYFVELGKAKPVAEGSDVTLITYSNLVPRCENLLSQWAEENISVELIDFRSLDYPSIDYHLIGESVKKTGAVVIVEEYRIVNMMPEPYLWI
ncbi:unnamed protein product, partial [marine sediment metagenome]